MRSLVLVIVVANVCGNARAEPSACVEEHARLSTLRAIRVEPPASYETEKDPKQTELPASAEARVSSWGALIATLQCPPELVLAHFLLGRHLWMWHDFERAATELRRMVDDYPMSDEAFFAFNLLADSLDKRKKQDELARALDAYCKDPASPTRRNPDIEHECRWVRERHYFH